MAALHAVKVPRLCLLALSACIASLSCTPTFDEVPLARLNGVARPISFDPPSTQLQGVQVVIGVVVPKEVVNVRAPNDATVNAVTVRVGDAVRRGSVLAELRSGDLEHAVGLAESTLHLSEEEVRFAEYELSVEEKLLDNRRAAGDLFSAEALVRVEREVVAATSRLKQARKRKSIEASKLKAERGRLDATIVRSPTAGVVRRVTAQPGETAAKGKVLVVTQSNEITLRFAVPGSLSSKYVPELQFEFCAGPEPTRREGCAPAARGIAVVEHGRSFVDPEVGLLVVEARPVSVPDTLSVGDVLYAVPESDAHSY